MVHYKVSICYLLIDTLFFVIIEFENFIIIDYINSIVFLKSTISKVSRILRMLTRTVKQYINSETPITSNVPIEISLTMPIELKLDQNRNKITICLNICYNKSKPNVRIMSMA